jgi:hypothetical protein
MYSCTFQQHSCMHQEHSLLQWTFRQHSCLYMLQPDINSTACHIEQADSTTCSNVRAAASICCRHQQHSFPQCTCQHRSCLYMLQAPTAQLLQCMCQQHSCLNVASTNSKSIEIFNCMPFFIKVQAKFRG